MQPPSHRPRGQVACHRYNSSYPVSTPPDIPVALVIVYNIRSISIDNLLRFAYWLSDTDEVESYECECSCDVCDAINLQ